MGIKRFFGLLFYKFIWRRKNKNNYTTIRRVFNLDNVTVGNFSYGIIDPIIANDKFKLFVGNFCSIAEGVVFIVGADHQLDTFSTFPFKNVVLRQGSEAVSKGDILIKDDVWIGYRSTILSGVTIGQGAVVAAGSVVTKDVPPYAVVGGVPAKIIRYRFPADSIQEMIKFDYSKLTKEDIRTHIDFFYKTNFIENIPDGLKKYFSPE